MGTLLNFIKYRDKLNEEYPPFDIGAYTNEFGNKWRETEISLLKKLGADEIDTTSNGVSYAIFKQKIEYNGKELLYDMDIVKRSDSENPEKIIYLVLYDSTRIFSDRKKTKISEKLQSLEDAIRLLSKSISLVENDIVEKIKEAEHKKIIYQKIQKIKLDDPWFEEDWGELNKYILSEKGEKEEEERRAFIMKMKRKRLD